MKNICLTITRSTVLVLFLLVLPGSAQNPPQQESTQASAPAVQFTTDVTLGGVFREVTNRHSSRFQYGRDVPRGFFLQDFAFTAETPGRPWHLDISGKSVRERDQQFRLGYDRFGKYRLDARWDQHFLSVADNIQSLHTATSKGVLQVPDLIQQQLELAPDSQLPALVNDILSATPFGRLQLVRRKLTVHQEYLPGGNWHLRVDVSNEIRSGDRRVSVGSYARTGTPQGNMFNTPGIEVPEPIDYRTTEVTAGMSYEGKRGFVRADYTGSFFRNRTSTLVFDNPFWFNDQLASRFRFRRTQVDLPPNNDVHSLRVSGAYSLPPWNTRLAGALRVSFWKQNDAFLPFTLNTSIVAPAGALPSGTTPTDLAALPQSSLNGQATSLASDLAFTTRPRESVRLAVRYNSFNWEDERDAIEFPGYAATGDSSWDERHPPGGKPIAVRLHPYFRQRSSANVVWKPRESVAWQNEFAWEGWNRENREVAHTDEWIGKTQLILKTNQRFYSKWNYSYADRIPQEPYDPCLEFVLLRKFDQAHRIRHNAGFLFQVNANAKLNFSGSYAYRSSRYDERLFGQAMTLNGFFVVDANIIPNDRFAAYVNFTRDRTRSTANLISKTGRVDYSLANTFIRDQNDRVDSLGAGFDANFLDNRVNWNVSYSYAFSRLRIGTTNPYPLDTQALLDATAYPLPDIEMRFHEARTNLTYQVRPAVQIGVRYSFEPRSVADFTTDLMGTGYIALAAAPETLMPRRIFLNARDSSYHAHIAAAFLRYSF